MFGGCSTDFQSKRWAENHLKGKPKITVLKNVLDLGFVENRGMVFGIFNGKMHQLQSKIIIAFRVLILLALSVFIFLKHKKSYLYLLPFLLIWAGAIGNLIDSFSIGYVIDFIHIQAGPAFDWPYYFNLADAYVTIGVGILLIYQLFQGAQPKTKS